MNMQINKIKKVKRELNLFLFIYKNKWWIINNKLKTYNNWDLLKDIKIITKFLNNKNNVWIKERIYCIMNNINKLEKCKHCNKNIVNFNNNQNKYRETCSLSCSNKYKKYKEKRENINIKKYWVKYTLWNKDIQKKAKITLLKNHDVDNPSKSIIIQNKKKITNIKRYWVDNPMKNKNIQDKMKKSINKYTIYKRKTINKKRIETCIKKYKVRNVWKLKEKLVIIKFNILSILYNINCNINLQNNILNKYKYKINCNNCNHITNQNYEFIYFRLYLKKVTPCIFCLKKKKTLLESNFNNILVWFWIKTILNDRKILNWKEIDIFLPNENIAIEINWLYWHSIKLGKDKYYHLNKTIQANKKNIYLIHILENKIEYWIKLIKQILWIENFINKNLKYKIKEKKDFTIIVLDIKNEYYSFNDILYLEKILKRIYINKNLKIIWFLDLRYFNINEYNIFKILWYKTIWKIEPIIENINKYKIYNCWYIVYEKEILK